ncbi:hypothetical protein [Sphingomonas ursincola]|uniref:hypothetical protein n=1 Tax=Sphingomonas ursincola TaxID=56361 RepID=UPI002357958A|nr:hypothetical protein [Sphingomonas ursincola]
MALTLSGCAEMFPEKYRFRLTVEVDTPQGLRSGSSVYEVWANNKTALLPEEASRDWGVRGEAVAVDLPNGQTLFALLKTNATHGDMAGLSMTALDPAFRNDIVESAARIASGKGVKRQAEVAPGDYPMLVTFRDLADPASVQAVTPTGFASVFGPGYALRRITVNITDQAVTTMIEKKLIWLSSYRNKTFAGNRYAMDNALADSLGSGSFSTEIVE